MCAPVEVAGVMMHAPAVPLVLHTAPGIRVRGALACTGCWSNAWQTAAVRLEVQCFSCCSI